MARAPSPAENSTLRPAIAALAICGAALVGWFTYDQLRTAPSPTKEFAAAESLTPGGEAMRAAPPMPYRFAGTSILDGKVQYLLEKDGRTLTVSPGMIIDRDYRVDVAGEQEIALVHLPTGVRQAVPMSQAPWPPPTESSTLAESPAQKSPLPPGVADGPGSPVRQTR